MNHNAHRRQSDNEENAPMFDVEAKCIDDCNNNTNKNDDDGSAATYKEAVFFIAYCY